VQLVAPLSISSFDLMDLRLWRVMHLDEVLQNFSIWGLHITLGEMFYFGHNCPIMLQGTRFLIRLPVSDPDEVTLLNNVVPLIYISQLI
jgi:hypothetical protein